MKVGIVGQKDNDRAAAIAADLHERLTEQEITVAIDEVTASALAEDGRWDGTGTANEPLSTSVDDLDECDLVVSVGGDGTFLFAARGAGTTPILGVNLGEVGFLNAVSPSDVLATVDDVVAQFADEGEVATRAMPRLAAAGDDWSLPPALNEIVVQGPQRGHVNDAAIEVRVDGSLYASGMADGVLVATPTGSTAYNLSEDGPLVHPGVDGFVVTEMCARESMPPLVVDTDTDITVRVESAESAVAVSDGRATVELDPPTQVSLSKATEPVHVAGPPLDFFTALGKLE